MAMWNFSYVPLIGLLSLFLIILHHPLITTATATVSKNTTACFGNIYKPNPGIPIFREAPAFRNGETCGVRENSHVHVAMTLDDNYLRGTIAAVFSILQHSTCPENVVFHFLCIGHEPEIYLNIKSTFPYLNFTVYTVDTTRVSKLISKSIRKALDQPLNYARIYIANIIPSDVKRVIYLDSDLIMVDDIEKLWSVDMENKVVAAPEYCRANFTSYFTKSFWKNPDFSKTFEGRKPCYFNTGVMVIDVVKWRSSGSTQKVEKWMEVQKKKKIYQLGSLPPFLLVLAGNIKGIDHRWNQHGIGGDNIEGKCRNLHPGPVSLLHWSGKGKPWIRLDAGNPCIVDHLWSPYDLFKSSKHSFIE